MDRTITSLSPNVEIVNVTSRRRWTIDEKVRMVEETFLPGASVSAVARRNGVNPNQLYKWRKFMDDGGKAAIQAEDQVVSTGELRALKKRVRELERMLGKKTMEAEILREMVELAQEKKLISRCPLPKPGDFQ